ncbi:T9SS type A sorting domain-containing protein, partial [Hymenobacter terrenus]|uniref:T9SS type A sorting domain-containing protein n=1 Tax=Hymenobacter terrenus TaxID=1629124 RepID=UPI0018CC86F4
VNTTTGCGTYAAGETEDYTLNVTGGTAQNNDYSSTTDRTDRYLLYPNPTTDVVHIVRPLTVDTTKPLTVRVYDLRGAEVRGVPFAEDLLHVATLQAGCYLVEISDGTTTSHQRLVKE